MEYPSMTAAVGDIGERIRAIRSKQGVSRLQLSHRANVSDVAIAAIENGESNPTIKTLCKLCDALGVDISDVV